MSLAEIFDLTYELPLSQDYVRDWGVTEAVREICQNALDSDSPFEWTALNGVLAIKSRHSLLEPKHLILGNTSKAANDDSIGQFGEGFKLALLVLAREKRNAYIINGDTVWVPKFKYSKKFGCEILTIHTSKYLDQPNGLSFVIQDLTDDEMSAIYESNLHMTGDVLDPIQTHYGYILEDHPGKLYVNGLFVCNTELVHGYDIKPQYLKLNRDRRSVESFDLAWTTAQMWLETKQFDRIAEGMAAKHKDYNGLQYRSEALVKEACYKVFKKKYGDKVAVGSQEELNRLAEKGITNTVYVDAPLFREQVTSSVSYRESPTVRITTPLEHIEAFLNDHKWIKRKAFNSCKDLLKQATKWRA